MILAQENNADVSIGLQAVITIIASIICQWLRRKLLAELLGKFNVRWLQVLCDASWAAFHGELCPGRLPWLWCERCRAIGAIKTCLWRIPQYG